MKQSKQEIEFKQGFSPAVPPSFRSLKAGKGCNHEMIGLLGGDQGMEQSLIDALAQRRSINQNSNNLSSLSQIIRNKINLKE